MSEHTKRQYKLIIAFTLGWWLGGSLACLFCHGAPLGPVQAVRNTNELAQLPNPLTKSTTTFVETQGTVGDGSASLWTWVLGATNAPDTNHVASLTMPGAGMFVRNTPATGGGTGSSLWTDFGTYIAPNILTNAYRIGTNGIFQLGRVGTDYASSASIGPSFYMFSDQTNGDFAEIYAAIWSGTNEVSGWDSFGDHTEWDTWQNMPVGYGWHTGNSGTSLVFEGFRQFNPTNVVRYMRLEPTVADGPTAVAYDYDTANSLTNAGALLARWRNLSQDGVLVFPDGTIYIGPSTSNYWGNMTHADALVSFRDSVTDTNSAGRNSIFIGGGNATNLNEQAYFQSDGQASATSSNWEIVSQAKGATNSGLFRVTLDSTGQASAALKNSFTTNFLVAASSGYGNGGTKALMDDGTYKIVFLLGTNTFAISGTNIIVNGVTR